MLEAIAYYRARLGMVTIMWVPSHKGIGPNAYADAVAKGAMAGALEKGITRRIAERVSSRQCIYERQLAAGGEWELWDRTVFAGARKQANGWVQAKLADGLAAGRIMAGVAGHWPELAKAVAKVGVAASEEGMGCMEATRANRITAFTFGARVGDAGGMQHGAEWRIAERGGQQRGEIHT
jgi:hypothetical protein